MKLVIAHCGNGYAGCDTEDLFVFDDDISDGIINDELWAWTCEHGESYAYVHFGWEEEYSEEEYDEYIENLYYDWKVVSYEEAVEWCENYGYDINDYLKGFEIK